MDFNRVPWIFWIGLLFLLTMLLIAIFQDQTRDMTLEPEGLALQLREKVGQPDVSYKEAQTKEEFHSFVKEDSYGRVFVCMTAMPNRLASISKSFATVPEHFLKVLILPQEFRNKPTGIQDESILAELHHKHKIQVLRSSNDFGPFTKSMVISESATSMRCGLDRTSSSRDIIITIDDDMYQSKDAQVSLVQKVVESDFRNICVGHLQKVDGLSFPVFEGKHGVAQPAKVWTSAWRGDVIDLWDRSSCKMEDDLILSFMALRFGMQLQDVDRLALQASLGLSKDRLSNLSESNFVHDKCVTFLESMPQSL